MNHFVYIIQSEKFKSYYIGCTNNINDRIKHHNNGGVSSTKFYRPWILRYKESYPDLSSARKRESQIKKWKSRQAIEKLFG